MTTTFSFAELPVLTFVIIPVLLVAALLVGVAYASRNLHEPHAVRRRAVVGTAAGAALWLAATWIAAGRGVLREWDRTPPPFAFLVLSVTAVSVVIASGPYGRRLVTGLPLWILVGIQGFRLPLEVAMHTMYERGIMPQQMSYSGRNFDIVTGITALIVAALLRPGLIGRRVVLAWNVIGLALLLNVVIVAILGTPRFRYFGDDALNVWITYPPFVWLPAVMVVAALAGHLIVFRALWSHAR
jgi:hypothetical protein